MPKGERMHVLMNKVAQPKTTVDRVLAVLERELAHGAKFVSYRKIAKEIGKSWHSVQYSIDKLRAQGRIRVRDGKLSLI